MKPALSFAQILEEKLAGSHETDQRTGQTQTPTHETTPSYIGDTVGDHGPFTRPINVDWSQLVKAKLQSVYPQTKSAKDTPPRRLAPKENLATMPPAAEETWPVSQLSTGARLSLETLAITAPAISLSTVKKAYRSLARRLHPDTGRAASPEAFLLLQESYDILTRELESLAKKAYKQSA